METSNLNEDIISQLVTFGYDRSEIIKAIQITTDKNDINAIQSVLDSSQNAIIPEITNESDPLVDISHQCEIETSGTETFHGTWKDALIPNRQYWCSKGKPIHVTIDVGQGGKVYVIALQFKAAAETIKVLTAATNDGERWEELQTVKVNETEDNVIAMGKQPNNQRFVRLLMTTARSEVKISFFQVYGIMGVIPQTQSIAYQDITAGITCIDTDKTFGHPVSNMYCDDSSYWASTLGNDGWMLFDCRNIKISLWQMVMATANNSTCGKVTFLTSDSKDGPFTKIKAGDPSTKLALEKNNKRYLRLEFEEVSNRWVSIRQLKVYVPEDEEVELPDDEKEDVAMNLEGDSLYVSTVGVSEGQVWKAYRTGTGGWACNRKECDPWAVFEINLCTIQAIEVRPGDDNEMTVWTASEFNDNTEWDKIVAKKMQKGKSSTVSIDGGKHERYLKLSFKPRYSGKTKIYQLYWFGQYMKEENDVTQEMKVVKASDTKFGDEVHNIFSTVKANYWSPSVMGDEGQITLDCKGKEVDTILIAFVRGKQCKSVSVLMAEIANDYSFTKVLKTFELSDDAKVVQILDIRSLNPYADGYKPFIRLQFTPVARKINSYGHLNDICVQQIILLGQATQSKDFEKEAEVTTIIDSSVETSSYGKIALIESNDPGGLPYNDGYGQQKHFKHANMWLDSKDYWQSLYSGDRGVCMIFDCSKYAVNIKKLSLKMNRNKTCGYCVISGADTRVAAKSRQWKRVGSIRNMDKGGAAFKTFEFGDKVVPRYLKVEFLKSAKEIGIERIRFIGLGLDEEYNLTLEQVMADASNVELIAKYLKTMKKQRDEALERVCDELVQIESENPLSAAWKAKKKELLVMPYVFLYNQQMAESLLLATEYEQGEAARDAQKALGKGEKEVDNALRAEIKKWQPMMDQKKKADKFEEEILAAFKAQDIDKGQKIRAEWLKVNKEYFTQTQTIAREAAANASRNADQIKKTQEKMEATASAQQAKRFKPIFAAWCESIDGGAKTLSSNYSVQQYLAVVEWANINRRREVLMRINKLADLLDDVLHKKEEKMHKFLLFQLSSIYEWARPPNPYHPRKMASGDEKNEMIEVKDPKAFISKRLCDEICKAVNIMRDGGNIESEYKHFVKFLLCWQNPAYYMDILLTTKRVMNLLRVPLDEEYGKLEAANSRLLQLSIDETDIAKELQLKTSSNLDLLSATYSAWYKPKTALFWPKDFKPIISEWKSLKFEFDDEFKDIRRDDMYFVKRTLCSSDDLAMTYLNCIANILNDSFQSKMRELFAKNRNKLGRNAPSHTDIGVHSGPVKTKSRQHIKIRLDYSSSRYPQCMAVLDIVRCAIVCEDDLELCGLFDALRTEFKGQFKRIKNAFDPVNGRDTYGYRAVLMNVAYGDEAILPYPKYRMICEIQLILNSYFQVRKKMHLGYGIVRSEGEEATKADAKAPHYVLAQDSCKFGKLDI
eukprot:945736_1